MKKAKKEYNKNYYYELSNKKYEIVKQTCDGDVKLHFHDYLELELILDGEATQYINDYKTHLRKGSFSLLRPNIDCHRLEITNLTVIKVYVKPFAIQEEIWKEISLLLDPLTVNLEGEEFEHAVNLFNAALYEQTQKLTYTDEIVRSIINSLICLFLKAKVGNENNVSIRKKLIKFLLDNDRYLTEVSLEDFSREFNYSLSHASKFFKDKTGMTFSEAKQFYRIQKAKRLLLSSNYSIAEISQMCGFNYYHLFHKVFKNNSGMTPLEFRKSNR